MRRSPTVALVVASAMASSCSAVSQRSGVVAVRQYGVADEIVLGATFADVALEEVISGEADGCGPLEVAGSCALHRCRAPTVVPRRNGTLTAWVRGEPLVSATLVSGGSRLGAALTASEPVLLTGEGADIPTFAVTTGVPEVPAGALPTAITASDGVTIAWAGAVAAEEIAVTLMPRAGPTRPFIECLAPAGDGSLAIPVELLEQVDAGDVGIIVRSRNQTETYAGAFQIAFRVERGFFGVASLSP